MSRFNSWIVIVLLLVLPASWVGKRQLQRMFYLPFLSLLQLVESTGAPGFAVTACPIASTIPPPDENREQVEYLDILHETTTVGITFKHKNALLTGVGKGTIGVEILNGLLWRSTCCYQDISL
ncbi:hypothetical protein BJ138DRAFT_1106108 [Hygrophoropsis aurantiaca]|uniref:Uncharacterized protein n=1 Tax=Hygrophoropsis aurantiaca TaxID=72124 RepID=A0ACB7ZWP3_9AGAM|nr:hypothetical protein BJ138DRAFT_1106108 [Hygrophoropsis aurantiaca]